jgi:hypothetical protein
MQWEYASAFWSLVAWLSPNAATGSARAAVAMMAAAVRALGGHARSGRRGTWMLQFTVPSSDWLIVSQASQPLLCWS